MKLEELREKAGLTDEQTEMFSRYTELLTEWNRKMNLTAITDPEEITEKHFYDCLLPCELIKPYGRVADVGSGAGFPGVVWKIAYPELDVTLIEPTGKRCTFLNALIRELHLEGITAVNERAEDYVRGHREEFDIVTARAVANLRILSELCVPLVKVNGLFLAMKGQAGMQENQEAENALKILGAEFEASRESCLSEGDRRINLWYRKIRKTPPAYPRHYSQIKKKPL